MCSWIPRNRLAAGVVLYTTGTFKAELFRIIQINSVRAGIFREWHDLYARVTIVIYIFDMVYYVCFVAIVFSPFILIYKWCKSKYSHMENSMFEKHRREIAWWNFGRLDIRTVCFRNRIVIVLQYTKRSPLWCESHLRNQISIYIRHYVDANCLS